MQAGFHDVTLRRMPHEIKGIAGHESELLIISWIENVDIDRVDDEDVFYPVLLSACRRLHRQ